MNKKGKLATKAIIGIALIFSGLIIASQLSLPLGIGMMGLGLILVLMD